MSLTKAFDALTGHVWQEMEEGDALLGRQVRSDTRVHDSGCTTAFS